MAEKKSLDSTATHELINVQNNTWSLKGASVCRTQTQSAPGLEQDQDIQDAVQNRDHWIETSHIDYIN